MDKTYRRKLLKMAIASPLAIGLVMVLNLDLDASFFCPLVTFIVIWLLPNPIGLKRVVVLTLMMALAWGFPSSAQLIPGLDLPQDEISASHDIPTFNRGNIDIAPVFLDGKIVGTVGSFVELESVDDNSQANSFDAATRAYSIHNKLQKILKSIIIYDREGSTHQGITRLEDRERELRKQLLVEAREQGGSAVVLVSFPRESDVPQILYSVTQADISRPRFISSQPLDIANKVSGGVADVLVQAWKERQDFHLRAQGRRALLVLVALMGMSASVAWTQKRLAVVARKQSDRLVSSNTVRLPDDWMSGLSKFVSGRGSKARGLEQSLRFRYSLIRFYAAVLYWGQWLIWTIGIGYLTSLFYWSRPLSNWIAGVTVRNVTAERLVYGWPPLDWLLSFGREANIGMPMFILLFVLLIRLTLKGGDALGDFFVHGWSKQQSSQQRQTLRSSTLSRAYKAWLRAIVYLLLVLAIVDRLHQLGTITRVGAVFLGLFSFALSLASQSLLKDLIAGLLILWEDQFAVGDVVAIDSDAGLVEKISLRVTQLRNLDGELISIPNGSIVRVKNLSSEWSRVNYAIEVAYDADLDRVMQAIEAVAQALYLDPDWQEQILEAPEILGVETIAHTGITIRLIIKTQPLQQWSVAREFRYRLKRAFDEQGIQVGVPQQKMYVNWTQNSEQPEFPQRP